MDATPRMPSLFVSHGTPLLLDDPRWTGELRAWADTLPRPRGILVLSAHWVTAGVITLGTLWKMPLQHDFKGLPPRYSERTYATPSARELSDLTKSVLEPAREVTHAATRPLDSGAYVPLAAMFPAGDVPVLQMSLSSLEIPALVEQGRSLAPLRDHGVLIVCSGSLVHNDRTLSFKAGEPAPVWARDFDAWVTALIAKRDDKGLAGYLKAPGGRMAHPTPEHLLPLAVALGSSLGHDEPVSFPITGFAYGSLARRSVQLG